jgi:tetratricopeptide (TPR) repeat protein
MQQFEPGEIVLPPQTPLVQAPPLPKAVEVPFASLQSAPYSAAAARIGKPLDGRERLWPALELWKHIVALLLFAAVVGMAFSNSYKAGMTLDNKYIIEEYYKSVLKNNPEVDPKSWTQVWMIFKNDYWWPKGISGLYRPITSLSYWFDYVILTGKAPKKDFHGNTIDTVNGKPIEDLSWADYASVQGRLNTNSYHTINLAVHWTNAVLIYFVALALTKRFWPSVFIAALFAAHPITVESVTNIIGRADMLAAVATFGGLLLYMRSRQNTDSWALPWLLGLTLITTFGVFSKESAAALVLVIICYDIAYNWRKGDERVKGLALLVGHGLIYLAMIGALIALPLAVSKISSDQALAAGMPAVPRFFIALVAVVAGVGQYIGMARAGKLVRLASVAAAAVVLALASVLLPYVPLVASAGIVLAELIRGNLTSDNPRFKVVAHSAMYLALYFILVTTPVAALYFFHVQGWNKVLGGYDPAIRPQPIDQLADWMSVWLRAPLAILAVCAGLFLHFVSIHADRPGRAVALVAIAIISVVASFYSYWLGILLMLVVATHELILGTFTPQENSEYRRDWKLIWHRFAIGYTVMIPPVLAMFAVRAWVFANATPAEEPFLDNPIRGIWKVAELNIPSFAVELARKPLLGMSFFECKMTAVKIMGRLLLLLTWPHPLCSDYSYAQIPNFSFTFKQGWDDVQAVLALLALVGIGYVAFKLYNRSRAAFFMILFFFAAALPTSNFTITIGSVMAERFMYLPLAGFTGVLVLGAFALSRKLFEKLQVLDEDDFPWHSVIPVICLSLVMVVYGVLTFQRNPVWISDRTLWEDAIKISPKAFRCYQSLAFALYEEGLYDGVPARYVDYRDGAGDDRRGMIALDEEGIKIVDSLPNQLNSSRMYLHLGMYYQLKADQLCIPQGDNTLMMPREAIETYVKSRDILERGVEVDRAFNELNKTKQRRRGDPEENINDAGLGPLYGTLAMAYYRLQRPDLALKRLQYGKQLDPTDASNYARLGLVQLQRRDNEKARVAFIEAILLEPTDPSSWKGLVQAYAADGDNTAVVRDPVTGNPKLNMQNPKLAEDMLEVYKDFIRIFIRSHRYSAAEDARRVAIQQYGFDAAIIDALFDEPVPAITPDGIDYDHTTPPPKILHRKKTQPAATPR